MKNGATRLIYCVAILLVFGFFAGCSNDDDPVEVQYPAQPVTRLAGSIGIYSDAAGTERNAVDTGGIVTLYVVHKVPQGGTASTFSVEAPAGWTYIDGTSQYPIIIGDVEDGVSIAYGSCVTGTIHLMTLTYQSPGGATAGATFKVLENPDCSENIQVVDCNMGMVEDGLGLETPVVLP